jgi:hypothetical protein
LDIAFSEVVIEEVSISKCVLAFDGGAISEHIASQQCTIWLGAIVTDPQAFFESFLPQTLGGRFSDALPEDTVVAFHIAGDGGGAWQMMRDLDGSRILPVDAGAKDCEMWCTADIFMRIIRGSLGSNRAFLSGDLRIAGDVGLALRLEGLLRRAA